MTAALILVAFMMACIALCIKVDPRAKRWLGRSARRIGNLIADECEARAYAQGAARAAYRATYLEAKREVG